MGAFDIQGKNCIFQVKIGDDYKTVVCAKSFTFNPVTDMKETTTVGSGFWKEYRPRKLSYTITFNGTLQVDSLSNQEIAKTLFDRQIQFFPFDYRLIYTDNSGNVMLVNGRAYVTSSLFDASPVNLVNATQELQGTGEVEVLDHYPAPINLRIFTSGSGSITALVQFKLFNLDGDLIFDSGQLPAASGGDLAHPFDVTAPVQSGSYYFFWQVTSDSVGNVFNLNAPPTKSTPFNNNTVNENTVGVQLYDFTADREASFAFGIISPPPACVAPTISTSSAPDGLNGNAWIGNVVLAGSVPFSLSNITKPAWMTITINNNVVSMSGTAATGSSQTISFDVTNACGTVNYSTTINIASNPGLITINYDYTEPGSGLGAGSALIIFKNSVQVVAQTTTGTGSISANTLDIIEARIFGPALPLKEIEVVDSIDGLIASDSTSGQIADVIFTLSAGHVYTITGTVTN